MIKAAGAMAVVFLVGGGAMTLWGSLFGAHAEAATLTLMGLAMAGTGHVLGSAPRKEQKLVTKPSEAQ